MNFIKWPLALWSLADKVSEIRGGFISVVADSWHAKDAGQRVKGVDYGDAI